MVGFGGLFAGRFEPFLEEIIPRFHFRVISVIDETDYGFNVAVFQNDDMRLRLMREEGAYLVYVGALNRDEWTSIPLVLQALGESVENLRGDVAAQADAFSRHYAAVAAELQSGR